MAEYEDEAFLDYVVRHLVDYPDEVEVNRTVDEMGVLLELSVHADDMGKVIGRNGNTAKAIRTLLRVVGMKNQARVNLKILEPEESARGAQGGGANSEDTSAASDAVDSAMEELKS